VLILSFVCFVTAIVANKTNVAVNADAAGRIESLFEVGPESFTVGQICSLVKPILDMINKHG
jgi:hypothetical protein